MDQIMLLVVSEEKRSTRRPNEISSLASEAPGEEEEQEEPAKPPRLRLTQTVFLTLSGKTVVEVLSATRIQRFWNHCREREQSLQARE